MLSTPPIYCVDLFGGLRVRRLFTPSAPFPALSASASPSTGTEFNAFLSRFRTHQTGALLAYLAHRAGRSQSREVLIEMLWPEVPQDSALARLSTALSSLRSQLEGAGVDVNGSPVPSGSIFQAERYSIGVTRFVTTDVTQFDALLDEAQSLRSANDAKRRDLMAAAMMLYHPELLPGYYEPWIAEEQERLTDRAREAFLWLAQSLSVQGDRLAAIGYAHQAIAAGHCEEAESLLERLEKREPIPATSSATSATERMTGLTAVSSRVSSDAPVDAPVARARESEAAVAGNPPGRLLLPIPLTRFLGRAREAEQLRRWVESREARLIVLTGPAGVGKSRLLREAVAQMPRTEADASLFALDLAPLTHPHELPQAVANAVGLPPSAIATVTTIADALAKVVHPTLLLDNIEQFLPEAGEWLESLLEASPHLTCVVTSRRRIDIDGECVLDVRPLALPDPQDTDDLLPSIAAKAPFVLSNLIDEWSSIALFVDRARNARPDFALNASNVADVLAIVFAVDGLPLALELAAAWAQVMTLPEMRRRLQANRFGLLLRRGSGVTGWRRGGEAGSVSRRRHASLRNVIAQTVDQMDDDLRRMLAALSVFRGGWTVAAAEAVTGFECALDQLSVLCDLSLVTSNVVADGLSDGGTTVRFSLLESIREYAAGHLSADSSVLSDVRLRHASYFAEVAYHAANHLQGKDQAQWLDRLQREDANLRVALVWSTSTANVGKLAADSHGPAEPAVGEPSVSELQVRVALSMGASLSRYWLLRGPVAVGRAHLASALVRSRRRLLQSSPRTHPASHRDHQGEQGETDNGRVKSLTETQRELLSKATNGAAALAEYQGDDVFAKRGYRVALFLDRHEPQASSETSDVDAYRLWKRRRAALLNNAANVHRRAGQYTRAYSFFDESLRLWRDLGEPRFVCMVLANLALIDRMLDRLPEAILNLRESLDVARACGNGYCEAVSLLTLGEIRHDSGDREAAGDLYRQSLRLLKPIGDQSNTAVLLFGLGAIMLEQASDVSERAQSRSVGERFVASALRVFTRAGSAPTTFVRRHEERLRAIGLWPESLADLDRWQADGFPLAMSLAEAIDLGLRTSSANQSNPSISSTQPSLSTTASQQAA